MEISNFNRVNSNELDTGIMFYGFLSKKCETECCLNRRYIKKRKITLRTLCVTQDDNDFD